MAFTAVLLAFFVPSVALSRVGRARKKRLVDIGKGGARDASQVLANGGVATICAVIAALSIAGDTSTNQDAFATSMPAVASSGAGLRGLLMQPICWLAAFGGAFAAATADTWGTEIGTLVRGTPRSIVTLRPIATGLSGGITVAGTLAEIAGAASIALASISAFTAFDLQRALQNAPPNAYVRLFVPIVAGGVAGAIVDSLLGATVQELRRCPVCARTCENDPHICGSPTILVRGVRGMSNDLVNAAATLTGAATAYFATLLVLLSHAGN